MATLNNCSGHNDIQALAVKCANSKRSCEWEGTVATLEDHMAACEYTLLPCSKQCLDEDGKVRQLSRKDMAAHLANECTNRESECEYCGEKGTQADLTSTHYESCQKRLIPCPNTECTKSMLPGDVERHLATECGYVEVSCKYRSIGCDVKLKRRDMAAHEEDDDKPHLHLALDTVLELKREKEIDIRNRARFESMTFKLVDYAKKKERNIKFMSPLFSTSEHGYNLTIRVDANGNSEVSGTHVSIFALFIPGEYDSELAWPFVGKITFSLLNQLEDENHIEKVLSFGVSHDVWPKDIGRGVLKFAPHSELGHDPVRNTQYLKDDTLYFRVSVTDIPSAKPWLQCTAETPPF